jgi:hypothetical protein
MKWLMLGAALIVATGRAGAGEAPLVEKYLHSGELAKGEQALEARLEVEPRNDQLRFGLGFLRFLRGVERLGQSLHEHGIKSESTSVPFLRLPVPGNPDPSPIGYHGLRRVFDDFIRDMASAESVLARITDDRVKLPIRLADIRLDLAGDGRGDQQLLDVLKKLMGRDLALLKENPDFLVCFDRGDVAWFRAYCHLLSAMLDFYLAFDTEQLFNLTAKDMFPRVKNGFKGTEEERNRLMFESIFTLKIKEPARLSRFRKHMLKVCELNRETWRFIRAERDDDHEWLPNPKQKGALGLRVTDTMIDAWLDMVDELEAFLEGKKLLPLNSLGFTGEKGLNIKKVLENPPAEIDVQTLLRDGPAAVYLETGQKIDLNILTRVASVFDDPVRVAYAMWFN